MLAALVEFTKEMITLSESKLANELAASSAAAAGPSYSWTEVGIGTWASMAAETYDLSGRPPPGSVATRLVLQGWESAGFPVERMLEQGWLEVQDR